MKQSIVILLKENKVIRQIRKRYDPFYKKFKLHINLVYPFNNIDQKQLITHIKDSIKDIRSFQIEFSGLKKSTKEYYLYLLINTGKDKLMKLYKNLNSGILKNFKNLDMPKYIPHISLGVFNSQKSIDSAIKELKTGNIHFKTKISEINLLALNKNHSIRSIKKFKLK